MGWTTRKQAPVFFDEAWSRLYRQHDALILASRQHYCNILAGLSRAFGRRIRVLDLGCGTGRYFHCLRNVERLVGMDVSPHMLQQARRPPKSDEFDIERIELLCGDVHALPLRERSFDLICSIGVFGEYTPFDSVLLARIYELLAPNGKTFFTVVDVYSRCQIPENKDLNVTWRALRKLFPLLPSHAKKWVNRALSSCYMTEHQLAKVLSRSQFAAFEISRYEHQSGWQGTHLDCLAQKS